MSDISEAVVVFIVVIVCLVCIAKCNNESDQRDQDKRKHNQQQIETCFPALFVQEVEIDGIKYEICRSEPGSKDFKLKEFAK